MMSEPADSRHRRPPRRQRTKDLPAGWELVAEYELEGARYAVIRSSGDTNTLTSRERQVLARAALGQTNKVIAFELGVSDSTIRVLMARACARLGVKTRAEAIAVFRESAKET
jgi:DNA-binding NarL/FixJ family response regulator